MLKINHYRSVDKLNRTLEKKSDSLMEIKSVNIYRASTPQEYERAEMVLYNAKEIYWWGGELKSSNLIFTPKQFKKLLCMGLNVSGTVTISSGPPEGVSETELSDTTCVIL